MIFKPVLVDQILAGNKTMTRRPVKYEEVPATDEYEAESLPLPCRYKVGRDYAVQPGRTAKGVARIKVVNVWREHWSRISPDDAIREGFDSREAFFGYVEDLYSGTDFDFDDPCWVIEFELTEASA